MTTTSLKTAQLTLVTLLSLGVFSSATASTIKVTYQNGTLHFDGTYGGGQIIGNENITIEPYSSSLSSWWRITASGGTKLLAPGYSKPVTTMYANPYVNWGAYYESFADVVIDLPGPNNTVRMQSVTLDGSLTIDTGDKTDTIEVSHCDIGGDVDITSFESDWYAGDADWIFVYQNSIGGWVTITGDEGDDFFVTDGTTADGITINPGIGNNFVYNTSPTFVDQYNVNSPDGALTHAYLYDVTAERIDVDGSLGAVYVTNAQADHFELVTTNHMPASEREQNSLTIEDSQFGTVMILTDDATTPETSKRDVSLIRLNGLYQDRVGSIDVVGGIDNYRFNEVVATEVYLDESSGVEVQRSGSPVHSFSDSDILSLSVQGKCEVGLTACTIEQTNVGTESPVVDCSISRSQAGNLTAQAEYVEIKQGSILWTANVEALGFRFEGHSSISGSLILKNCDWFRTDWYPEIGGNLYVDSSAMSVDFNLSKLTVHGNIYIRTDSIVDGILPGGQPLSGTPDIVSLDDCYAEECHIYTRTVQNPSFPPPVNPAADSIEITNSEFGYTAITTGEADGDSVYIDNVVGDLIEATDDGGDNDVIMYQDDYLTTDNAPVIPSGFEIEAPLGE